MASSAFDLYHQDVYQFIELERLHGSMKGQNVLVTGAGRGIGRAISLAFAKVGANVACLARTEVEIASVAHEIRSLYNVTATYRVADVTDNEKLTCAVMSLSDELGSIDILVNIAGITRLSPFEFEDMSTWWSVLETNLRAPVVLTHLLLPSMISRGSGTIISIGSRCAANNMPFSTAYSAAKTALLRFHQCLDLDFTERVSAIMLWSLVTSQQR